MNRASKVATFAFSIVGALSVALLAQHFGRSTVDFAYENYKQAAAEQSIGKQLDEAAQIFNKQLPTQALVNQQMQMDSVAAGPGKQLTFFFTVRQVDQLTDEQLKKLFVRSKDRLCSSNLRQLLNSGVTFNYRYRDEDARWVKDVTVQSQDCAT